MIQGEINNNDVNIKVNDSSETVTIKLNGKVVNETKSEKSNKKGKLEINNDGVIIKTE